MKYFKVTTKCAHVGRLHCIWIDFAVPAISKKQAAQKAKKYKRVKRDHKDVVKNVVEINFEEFIQLKFQNDIDPYLHCTNIQQQRQILGFEERIEIDEFNLKRLQPKHKSDNGKNKRNLLIQLRNKEHIAYLRENI